MIQFKTWFLSLAMLTCAVFAQAQEAPKTTEFEVNGLKVILRESVKGTVSARLFIQGGTVNYPEDKEGVESMALSLAMQAGSADMTKDEFNLAAESVGATMGETAITNMSKLNTFAFSETGNKSLTRALAATIPAHPPIACTNLAAINVSALVTKTHQIEAARYIPKPTYKGIFRPNLSKRGP